MAEPPPGPQAGLGLDDLVHQQVGVQLTLDQHLGLALADQLDRPGGGLAVVEGLDDPEPSDVEAMQGRHLGNPVGWPDQHRVDEPGLGRLDGCRQRRLVARVGHGRPGRRKPATAFEQPRTCCAPGPPPPGARVRGTRMRAGRVQTTATPVATATPCWLTHRQSNSTMRPSARFARAVTVAVTVSLIRTVARNRRSCDSYTVPGPGSLVPSTPEISAAPEAVAHQSAREEVVHILVDVRRVDVARDRREQAEVLAGQGPHQARRVFRRGSRRRCG